MKKKPIQVSKIKPMRRYAIVGEPYSDVYGNYREQRHQAIASFVKDANYPNWEAAKSAGFTVRTFRIVCVG